MRARDGKRRLPIKYAILADIHANRDALSAVLADIDARGIGRIVCLGDVVGYGPEPDECVAMLADRDVPCVRGNHDAVAAGLRPPLHFGQRASHAIRWTRRHLGESARTAIAAYPLTRIIDERFMLVHAALHPRPNDVLRIRNEEEARLTLRILHRDFPGLRLCFFGHTHLPAAYQEKEGRTTRQNGDTVAVHDGAAWLVNPGSVGWSREEPRRACYATCDMEGGVSFHQVEYDVEAFERKLAAAGLNHRSSTLGHVGCWMRDRFHEARAAVAKLGT